MFVVVIKCLLSTFINFNAITIYSVQTEYIGWYQKVFVQGHSNLWSQYCTFLFFSSFLKNNT